MGGQGGVPMQTIYAGAGTLLMQIPQYQTLALSKALFYDNVFLGKEQTRTESSKPWPYRRLCFMTMFFIWGEGTNQNGVVAYCYLPHSMPFMRALAEQTIEKHNRDTVGKP